MLTVAAVVDSRNALHAAADVLGMQGLPTVQGVVDALAPAGYAVAEVHVGLALARPSDQQALAGQHARNLAYSQRIDATGGHVLAGELHHKNGQPQEKMVDGLCNVRIAKLAEQIRRQEVPLDGIVVLSQDIDLTPGIDHAVELGVPVAAVAQDVVQHRSQPYLLTGPWGYERIVGGSGDGFGRRRDAVAAILAAQPVMFKVLDVKAGIPPLRGPQGERADVEPGTALPPAGQSVALVPVGAYTSQHQRHPVLICADAPRPGRTVPAVVQRRQGPFAIKVDAGQRGVHRVRWPLGGAVPGETVLLDFGGTEPCAIGPCGPPPARPFDPDVPNTVEVFKVLDGRTVLVRDPRGTRGIATTTAGPAPGQTFPALQVDAPDKGPVWIGVGSPCPR